MVKNLNKDLDRTIKEIKEFIDESRDPKEKIEYMRKQLTFLKAKVPKRIISFKEGMRNIELKKQRRASNIARKEDLGIHRKKK
jgi:DNA-binding transcriptional MerR regulator